MDDPLKDQDVYDRYATPEWIAEQEKNGLKFKRTEIMVPYRGAMVHLYNAADYARAVNEKGASSGRPSVRTSGEDR